MTAKLERILYFLGLVLCGIVISLCFKGTAHSMEKNDAACESYYRTIEAEYIKEVKSALTELGYKNSGVMLNRIVNAEGGREYTLSINNKSIKSSEEIEDTVKNIWYNSYSIQLGGYSNGSDFRTNISAL